MAQKSEKWDTKTTTKINKKKVWQVAAGVTRVCRSPGGGRPYSPLDQKDKTTVTSLLGSLQAHCAERRVADICIYIHIYKCIYM